MNTDDVIKVFVGFDKAESVAYHVLNHSIQRRSSRAVSVTPIMLSQLEHLINRAWHPKQSNEFAFSRWLVPHLCGYVGWAIWMDCDMLMRTDIVELWGEATDIKNFRHAVQVVKHTDYIPRESSKYLDRPQSSYAFKNWSSVMVFNCSHQRCRFLTPHYVNTASGLDLHQFAWIDSDEEKRQNFIGQLDSRWNHLVGVHEPRDDAALVHYTIGGPYFTEYRDCEYGQEWWDEYRDMIYCKQKTVDEASPLTQEVVDDTDPARKPWMKRAR